MTNSYRDLITENRLILAEPSRPYSLFTERHLQVIWFEQKYFKELKTSQNQDVKVISPGIWNQGPGPDFQKAHLLIDGKELYGDIELHLSPEDWYHHGHDTDARYSDVILHISLWPFRIQNNLSTPSGKPILQVYLAPFFTIPETRILQLIDLDLYPYTKFVGSGRCSHQLFRDLPEENIKHLFSSAAMWRLEKKQAYLEGHCESPEKRAATGMALALGYKQNSQSFLQLYHWLSSLKSLNEESLLALALGSCGFFEPPHLKRWGNSEYYRHLSALYMMLSFSIAYQPKFQLTLSQIRPFNHPVRRLAALVKVVRDPQFAELENTFHLLWRYEWKQEAWASLRKSFIETLPDYEDSYWNLHYTFEPSPQTKLLPLLGASIKQEMIINTILPLLHGKIQDDGSPEEVRAFLSFFESFPALKAGKSKYLIHRFFGDTFKGAILNNSLHEQGAFQIHKDFCIHYEASCEGCPFVEKVAPRRAK